PRPEHEFSRVGGVHIGTGNVAGEHVRCALHATEVEAEGGGQAPCGDGLPEARHVFEQHMTAGEDGRQRDLQRVVHTDHSCANGRKDLGPGFCDGSVLHHCFSLLAESELFAASESMTVSARSMSWIFVPGPERRSQSPPPMSASS